MFPWKYLSKFCWWIAFLVVNRSYVFFFYSYIDEGRNPQLYTKECMEKALNKNEQVKGKIDSYRKFRAHLLEELSQVFPNETMKYRTARGDDVNRIQ